MKRFLALVIILFIAAGGVAVHRYQIIQNKNYQADAQKVQNIQSQVTTLTSKVKRYEKDYDAIRSACEKGRNIYEQAPPAYQKTVKPENVPICPAVLQ